MEPLDPSEAHWFVNEWQEGPLELTTARSYFDGIACTVREFLGVELADGELADRPSLPCAFLRATVDDANHWSRLADLPLRFEHDPRGEACDPKPLVPQRAAEVEAETRANETFDQIRAIARQRIALVEKQKAEYAKQTNSHLD